MCKMFHAIIVINMCRSSLDSKKNEPLIRQTYGEKKMQNERTIKRQAVDCREIHFFGRNNKPF